MLITLASICFVIGVIILVLSAFGIIAGITPYGNHGGVTLIVVGIILYVLAVLLPHVAA